MAMNTEHWQVRLPERLAKAADEVAETAGIGRSTLLRIALADYVSRRGK